MTWIARHTSDLEEREFQRLRQTERLISQLLPQEKDKPYEPIVSEPLLKDCLVTETAQEFLARYRERLRALFETSWTRNTPLHSRHLRFLEEEALRTTSESWKKFHPGQFEPLGSTLSAYRETPFYCLYRDEWRVIRASDSEILIQSPNPAIEAEASWMRGFLMYLRPKTVLQTMADHFVWKNE